MNIDCRIEKLGVVGLGYIGLPTAALFASRGLAVLGFDVEASIVETVNKGGVHIIEPGLDIAVRSAVTSGALKASTKVEPCDAFIIAVPTPFREGHEPDLSFIDAASDSLAPVLRKGNLVVLESTSPVGTTRKLAARLQELRPDLRFPLSGSDEEDVFVAYCPERVLPGNVMRELIENDRVVGGLTLASTEKAMSLYKILVDGDCVPTKADTAELVKITENAFRDVNIAFANELSLICRTLKLDVWEVIRLANRHPRVKILRPGPGVGGHCIAVDPWFIVHSAPEDSNLIRTARQVNDSKPKFVVDEIRQAASKFSKPVIACLGLSFKPDIDDLRESPALEIVNKVATFEQATILAVEPNIDKLPASLANRPNLLLSTIGSALVRADILVFLVNHKAFSRIRPDQLVDKIIVNPCGWNR